MPVNRRPKLTLIMPSIGRKPDQRYIATWQMEPLVLAVLAALTPPDWEITIQDDRLVPVDTTQPADLVGITVETYTAKRAYQIAAEYRRRGVKVVMGGYHPTLWTDEVLEHADCVVTGPAEGIWGKVLADVSAGCLQKRYDGPFDFAWKGLFPRREVYADKNYLPLALVEFSRGCRFHCQFCAITAFTRGRHYYRPPSDVAEEIRRSGQKIVFLIDDNIAANHEAAFALCEALKPLGVSWVSQISVDAAADGRLVRAMAEAGCIGVLIGFESLRADLMQRLNKKCNGSIELYERALAQVRINGICVYAAFLFGIDGDDRGAFPRTFRFIQKHRFFLAAFNHLVPFPGTPLYARLEAMNRLTSPAWWLDSEFRFGYVPFHPQEMSAQELAETCRHWRRRFYSWRSIIHRALDARTNARRLSTLAMFLTQNFFGRREVDEKYGLPLGMIGSDQKFPV
ncbi:MAG TPA: radical SAM protein [Candidatus Ozemobacteraceae bacterium]|nr:radical SAM protein [Candidatus Ozemobacteraceae bacterium]